jgi:hypothetical protein
MGGWGCQTLLPGSVDPIGDSSRDLGAARDGADCDEQSVTSELQSAHIA